MPWIWFDCSINPCFHRYVVKILALNPALLSTIVSVLLLTFSVNSNAAIMNPVALGGDFSTATAINDRGEIVGATIIPNGPIHGFRYEKGSVAELDTPGDDQTVAAAINDAGQIVGATMRSFTNEFGMNYLPQAALFRGGLLITLVPGTNYSFASGINNQGEIAGVYTWPDGTTTHAFLYKKGMTADLGTLGGDFSEAQGINNRGEIVGLSNLSQDGALRPFLYSRGRMYDLGTFGGNLGSANAINDLGEIVGYSTTSNWQQRPFLYSHGRMHDLGTLGDTQPHYGGNYNYAAAINNWGQVVGQSLTANGSFHAFLYSNGRMIDLNNLVKLTTVDGPPGFLLLMTANGINDRGQIVGIGAFWDGKQIVDRAFLLQAVSFQKSW